MRPKRSLAVVLAAGACLLGCFVAEEFTATLDINKDRNFEFSYDGTIVFALK